MQTLGERIAVAMANADLTQAAFARRVGVSQSTVSLWINDHVEHLLSAHVVNICKATNRPIEFFFPELQNAGDKVHLANGAITVLEDLRRRDERGRIPIIGMASCGPGINIEHLQDEIEWVDLNEEFADRGADLVITVDGDSMATRGELSHHVGIEHGDLVGIKQVDAWDQIKKHDVVLITIAKEATLKEYVGITDGHVLLMSWNQLYDPMSLPTKKVTLRGVYVGHIHLAGQEIRRRRRASRGRSTK